MLGLQKSRKAGITVEAVFSILLTLGALFLVLGLFSDNLKSLFEQGGMQNAINATAAKTDFKNLSTDPTVNKITAPEVQMAGWEAILANYNKSAKNEIEHYYNQVKSGSELQKRDKINLAMWLTIFANSSTTGSGVDLLSKTKINDSVSYFSFGSQQGIDLSLIDTEFSLTCDDVGYGWNSSNLNIYAAPGLNISAPAKDRVTNIRQYIMPVFNH